MQTRLCMRHVDAQRCMAGPACWGDAGMWVGGVGGEGLDDEAGLRPQCPSPGPAWRPQPADVRPQGGQLPSLGLGPVIGRPQALGTLNAQPAGVRPHRGQLLLEPDGGEGGRGRVQPLHVDVAEREPGPSRDQLQPPPAPPLSTSPHYAPTPLLPPHPLPFPPLFTRASAHSHSCTATHPSTTTHKHPTPHTGSGQDPAGHRGGRCHVNRVCHPRASIVRQPRAA